MREILLINVAGEDKPGITSAVSRVLDEHGADILDIGQAVIHDNLNLGILAKIPEGQSPEKVQKEILYSLHAMDMKVRFQPISEESYEHWVAQQGKPRHIVTLLARRVAAHHIARVTAVTVTQGLNIDKITRLSGRVPLEHMEANTKACVEFSLRGEPDDLGALRASLLELSTELDIDIAYQEDNIYRRNRRLVVFDMDSTLIEAEVIDELAREAGVGDEVAAITEAAMRGELDFIASFSKRLGLLQGLDASVLDAISARLKLTEGAELLISNLRRLGYKTAILSGGFDFFARRIQEQLGIDYVYANQLEIEGGKVTGRVTGEVVDGQRKAQLLRDIAARENISLEQVIAVGDGANDLPMLSIAGLGIAFRAKPLVKANAKQSISKLGLDGILYLMGLSDRDTLFWTQS
ncbi:phosphoserine phosphatase SerB [Porticoccus litoralis]|uniref:Phosphoserine phosphatase n=1 Tax=Porticoccus litoralis TaxID=434086 RepID=A0AAW8B382_9GAMM|nr:phosphoserine phosphatase SerB [Porticoccus litoralis]MDP1520396.1 phosphoserine phosphatase SerB [Porticoccus litoralis]